MTNLGLAGASSLQSLNQWISVIDTNISSSKRIGYKETRISLKSNEIEVIGKTSTHFGTDIQVPSSSLLVDKTLILDYVQGSLTNTDNITDFAIEGKGYFVVEDVDGKKYATRDGQFHFSTDGILVNADGLKVLTYGQDYVRAPVTEEFSINSSGTSLATAKYGDRRLMVIDLPNAGKLYYSKYGFSTFELGDLISIDTNNNFDKAVDGLNPYLADKYDPVTGVNLTNYQQYYTHNKSTPAASGNVVVDISSNNQALLTAHAFTDFNNAIRFTSNTDLSALASYGFNFGQKKASDTLSDSGYFAGIENGYLVVKTALGDLTTATPLPSLPPGTEYEMAINVNNGTVKVVLTDTSTGNVVASVVALGVPDYQAGYQSVGTNDVDGATAGATVTLNYLHIAEAGGETYYNTVMLGGNADIMGSLVRQQYVEESTGILADQLPILSNAQKMFSAIGKIISVSNAVTDDLNGLIR
jgi:flagellar hook-basal body protein